MKMQNSVDIGPGAEDFGVNEHLARNAQPLWHTRHGFAVEPYFHHLVFGGVAHTIFRWSAGADENAAGARNARADMPTKRARQLHLAQHAASAGDTDAQI